MTLLSHDLAGITFPYDQFVNHLDSSGKTIDREMEERGFQNTIFHYDVVPFDLHWPFMKDNIGHKFCKTCGKYWQRKAVMKCHQNTHKK